MPDELGLEPLESPDYVCGHPLCGLKLNHARENDNGVWEDHWYHGTDVTTLGIPDHEPMPKIDSANAAKLMCDFCSKLEPEWIVQSKEFDGDLRSKYRTVHAYSSSDWMACEDCKKLIDLDARRALRQRVIDKLLARYPRAQRRQLHAGLDAEIKELHDGFWAGYEGKVTRVR